MGVDYIVGKSGTDTYLCEKIGSAISMLGWTDKIKQKSGMNLIQLRKKYPLVFDHSYDDNYEVNELHELLRQLNELKRLEIEEQDTFMEFEITDKKQLSYKRTSIVKARETTLDKLVKVCEFAIKTQQPIRIGY